MTGYPRAAVARVMESTVDLTRCRKLEITLYAAPETPTDIFFIRQWCCSYIMMDREAGSRVTRSLHPE
jgi:hypothetical protein